MALASSGSTATNRTASRRWPARVRCRRRRVASSRPGAPRGRGAQAARRALDLRLDGERLCRQPHDRSACRYRADPPARGAGNRAQHRGDLWRRQGRVRAGDRRERLVCRAGLIVGPEDPTGRFTYWPTRLDRGGEVLVAGTPDDAVQLIDVRDLAQWIVHAARSGLTGCFDGIGPSSRAASSWRNAPALLARDAPSPGSTARFWRARTSSAGPARVRCRCGSRCRTMPASTRATRHRHAPPA